MATRKGKKTRQRVSGKSKGASTSNEKNGEKTEETGLTQPEGGGTRKEPFWTRSGGKKRGRVGAPTNRGKIKNFINLKKESRLGQLAGK